MVKFKTVMIGGTRAIETIAATAGNVVTNLTPGIGIRWIVIRGKIVLVTDATVVNRLIETHITDGTNVITKLLRTANIPASLTRSLFYNTTQNASGGAIAETGAVHLVMNNQLVLEGDDQFRITITNGVAGDSYSGYLVVLEAKLF